jgi:hypothetical protein
MKLQCCVQVVVWRDKEEHEEGCLYAVGHCPFLSCSQVSRVKEVTAHMALAHRWTQDTMHHRCVISIKNY